MSKDIDLQEKIIQQEIKINQLEKDIGTMHAKIQKVRKFLNDIEAEKEAATIDELFENM